MPNLILRRSKLSENQARYIGQPKYCIYALTPMEFVIFFPSQDVLANDEYKIDYGFKLSMAIDIAAVTNPSPPPPPTVTSLNLLRMPKLQLKEMAAPQEKGLPVSRFHFMVSL